MTVVKELKPCPFCGGPAKLYTAMNGMYIVQCGQCGCGTLHKRDKESVIEDWNRRAGGYDIKKTADAVADEAELLLDELDPENVKMHVERLRDIVLRGGRE